MVVHTVASIDPEVNLVLEDTLAAVPVWNCDGASVLSDRFFQLFSCLCKDKLLKESLFCIITAEIFVEFGGELWLCEVDDKVNTIALIIRVSKLSVSYEFRLALLLIQWKERHSSLCEYFISELVYDARHLLLRVGKAKVDFNLVVDADT